MAVTAQPLLDTTTPLLRSTSDLGPRGDRGKPDALPPRNGDSPSWIRHGWEEQLESEEYLNHLSSNFYLYYTEKRHETGGNPKDDADPLQEWRMKDRLKTVSAALAICLNLGVDPPDVIKTNPCAKLEAWVDPAALSAGPKAMETIGKNLQSQYETLSIRTRYRQHLDPSIDETKKFCCQLRRNAKDERVLFHYNGHGVPKPTVSGEIWVFNKNFTQYIPISLYDLQSWLGAPSLLVYDCSDAGNIIHNFHKFLEKHEMDNAVLRQKDPHAQLPSYHDCIQLAACGRNESLPTSPDLPADLFTCCLTTPIEIALRFFVLQNPLPSHLTIDDVSKMPGRLQERRTPMGELNWIFTAITDTIAWNTLPRGLFKKLFRQDLMVAALFRNFLLSQRIMRVHQCHPMSSPALPDTYQHPLWQSWDLAVEMVLGQLPALLEAQAGRRQYEYQHSTFFAEQLTAFEVYLEHGAVEQRPPDQLPIVLQVLLSQVHRLRALILLSKFLDMGPWAVNLALSIGIFPYVLKLLQSAAAELKPVMVFIWARILAVDRSCQGDLLKDSGYQYFIQILNPSSGIPIANASEHRAMCAFILARFCTHFPQGQVVCLDPVVVSSCLTHMADGSNPLLRQWACLCLAQLWRDHADAQWMGIREGAPARLCALAQDPVPEVRAAMLYALRTFLGIPDVTDQVATIEETVATTLLGMTHDGSALVRREWLAFCATFVQRYEHKFLVAAFESLDAEAARRAGAAEPTRGVSQDTIYAALWTEVLMLSVDPHPEMAQPAGQVVDYVLHRLVQSPLGRAAQRAMDDLARPAPRPPSRRMTPLPPVTPPSSGGPGTPGSTTTVGSATTIVPDAYDGSLLSSLKRTASVAASLKRLAFPATINGSASPRSSSYGSASLSGRAPRPSGPLRVQVPAEWSRPPTHQDPPLTPPSQLAPPTPLPRRFTPRALDAMPTLPLTSHFLEWSVEYFQEPQMKQSDAEEPGSTEYNARLWRRTRNEQIIHVTQPQKELAGRSGWETASQLFDNGSQPTKMVFHQFADQLAVADERDVVTIWDWANQTRLNRFANGNPAGTKITEVTFINEDDQALLLTGSSEGVMRVFRHADEAGRTELVSAWRALTNLVEAPVQAGLVFEWQQGHGKALIAGDVKVIRVWNAATEMAITDIPARSGACITSLTSDQVAGDVFVAGFGDGAVRVYDQRNRPREAMVRVWREHRQWITGVHLQRGGARELVSGSRNGEVKVWDLRHDRSLHTIVAADDALRALGVHEHAPVFACGTGHNAVQVFNIDGTPLSTVEPYSSFLHHHRTVPIAALAFHPHRMKLACSALTDHHVNVFSCEGKRSILMEE
ncbi:MAG: hypothetical protein M1838_002744 [Thelocarpon superellum]|nr:MAG: hypothetical protein M1838_002744 [Thelocarpon superellum]